VTKFRDIVEKIIPLFQQHPIHGVKAKDFADFCQVAEMINKKEHLTKEGLVLPPTRQSGGGEEDLPGPTGDPPLDKIKQIKSEMNKGRK